ASASFSPTTYTFVAGDSGAHTFSGTLKTAGSQTLSATDSADGFIASQTGITVVAAAASSLTLAGYPATTTAGVAQSFTVTAKDTFGNVATSFVGIVTLSSSDASASFSPTTYTFVAGDSGAHTFSGTLKTVGS